jgi:hypothetical protein
MTLVSNARKHLSVVLRPPWQRNAANALKLRLTSMRSEPHARKASWTAPSKALEAAGLSE